MNGPEYLIRSLSFWGEFYNIVWFREIFSFPWDALFNLFFHFHLFDGAHFQYSRVPTGFLFSVSSDFFLDLVVLFLPSIIVYCFSSLAWHILQSQIPSLYPDCIFSLTILGPPILFFIFGKQSHILHVHEAFDLSCCLVSLLPSVYFVSIWQSGISAITNSKVILYLLGI